MHLARVRVLERGGPLIKWIHADSMHLARVRVLKRWPMVHNRSQTCHALIPCEVIETTYEREYNYKTIIHALIPCEGIETSSALLKYFVIIDASSLSAGIILHSYYCLHWRSWAIVYIPRYRRLFITS